MGQILGKARQCKTEAEPNKTMVGRVELGIK